MSMSLISCAVLICTLSVVLADGELKNAVDDLTTTKGGDLYCPVPIMGTKCPSSSIFHFYQCCGDLNKDCCFNLQVWVIVVLAVIAVVMLASFVLSVIRCICCRRG